VGRLRIAAPVPAPSNGPRVAICHPLVPSMWGGAEQAVGGLYRALAKRGFRVQLVEIPFAWSSSSRLIRSCVSWRLLDLTAAGATEMDIVIAGKFPSYFVKHPRKVVWLIHQYRPVYDQAKQHNGGLRGTTRSWGARQAMKWADSVALKQAERLFTISANVSRRLSRFNGIQAPHLYPPPPHVGEYMNHGYGNYLFTVSRLDGPKRVGLLVDAMRWVDPQVTCLIAGTGPDATSLQQRIGRLGLTDRVKLLGAVDHQSLLRLYAGAFAVYFGPLDEDLGLVTLEAMASEKPVITLADSGGPLEFVDHGVTGWVSAPDPASIADVITRAYREKALCAEIGAVAKDRVDSLTWDKVIDALITDRADAITL
jgi:glycosyltransferase involved in cell wall biosynthesis